LIVTKTCIKSVIILYPPYEYKTDYNKKTSETRHVLSLPLLLIDTQESIPYYSSP
jgi:hypothetical protein